MSTVRGAYRVRARRPPPALISRLRHRRRHGSAAAGASARQAQSTARCGASAAIARCQDVRCRPARRHRLGPPRSRRSSPAWRAIERRRDELARSPRPPVAARPAPAADPAWSSGSAQSRANSSRTSTTWARTAPACSAAGARRRSSSRALADVERQGHDVGAVASRAARRCRPPWPCRRPSRRARSVCSHDATLSPRVPRAA